MGQATPNIKTTIITPLFFGDASGASVYCRLLASFLLDKRHTVSVISDGEAGDFQGRYYGLFPQRCGREKKFPRDMFAYAIQNLKYCSISEILRREQPNNLLVHSSFYNYPGIFATVMKKVRRRFPDLKMVLDVRDRLLPKRCIRELDIYDEVVACSENVVADLQEKGLSRDNITLIPVLQEKLSVDAAEVSRLLERLGIRQPYIYYAGLVKESKGVDMLLEAFVHHIRERKPELTLVLSGLMKTKNHRIISLLQKKGVRYVGNRSRDEVLQLMAGASICVNLSPNEGMPRSCLEALALGKPVVLPPNIPEFEYYCPHHIASSGKPEDIAQKILLTYREKKVPTYPIAIHYPEQIMPRYLRMLKE